MSDIEARLRYVEDRFALEDVIKAYCTAVDSLTDLNGLLDCFTDDAVVDLTGLNLDVYEGQAAIRKFFAGALDGMTHHAHYATNFTIERLEGDQASCRNYIIGMGIAKDGNEVLVHARYDLELVRTAGGWKIARFEEPVLMPLPKEVVEIHG